MKKKYILIAIIVVILLAILAPVGLLLLNNTKPETINNVVSQPISTTVSEPISFVTDSHFYEKYLSNDIKSLKVFPFEEEYESQYYNFNLNVKDVPLKIILLDASGFKSSREMIEKMYLSNNATGNLASSYSVDINNTKFEMGIMNVPVGQITYMLFGGFIKENRGYYFNVFLERSTLYNLTDETFPEVFQFNHKRNPKEILQILSDLSTQNLSKDFFKKFDNSKLEEPITKNIIEQRRKFDGFPTTF